jgi:hypothetical protein
MPRLLGWQDLEMADEIPRGRPCDPAEWCLRYSGCGGPPHPGPSAGPALPARRSTALRPCGMEPMRTPQEFPRWSWAGFSLGPSVAPGAIGAGRCTPQTWPGEYDQRAVGEVGGWHTSQ